LHGASQPLPNTPGYEDSPEEDVPLDAARLAAHYEQNDVNIGGLVRFTIGLGILITVVAIVSWLIIRTWTKQALPIHVQIAPAVVTMPAVPGPGLDAAPEERLEDVLRRDAERLNTYAWIDRDGGVVRIPIAEAMRLLAERGLPAKDGKAPDFRLDPAFRMDGSGGVKAAGGDAENE
jgi:hypothetical protein